MKYFIARAILSATILVNSLTTMAVAASDNNPYPIFSPNGELDAEFKEFESKLSLLEERVNEFCQREIKITANSDEEVEAWYKNAAEEAKKLKSAVSTEPMSYLEKIKAASISTGATAQKLPNNAISSIDEYNKRMQEITDRFHSEKQEVDTFLKRFEEGIARRNRMLENIDNKSMKYFNEYSNWLMTH